jgi:hypothetical protein
VKTWHIQTEDKWDDTVDGRHFMGLWNVSFCIVSYLPLENFLIMILGATIRELNLQGVGYMSMDWIQLSL